MECPRCKFNQPDDKYCANCGLDVESFNKRPKPLWMQVLQDPNFYAFLFGGILISAACYIVINQRTVGRQVGKLFHNTFILSRDARVPGETEEEHQARKHESKKKMAAPVAEEQAPAEVKEATPSYTHLTVRFYEISKELFTRENLTALNGRVMREDQDWRVVYFEDAKTLESLKSSAGRVPGSQEKQLQSEINIEQLDAGDTHPDQQMPYMAIGVDLTKTEPTQPSLHFAVDMQVPTGSSAQARNVAQMDPNVADTQTQQAQTSSGPMNVESLEGTVKFKPQGALLLIYDPVNRSPASADLGRLTQSPLRVYNSDDFRMGYSDLIVWISFH